MASLIAPNSKVIELIAGECTKEHGLWRQSVNVTSQAVNVRHSLSERDWISLAPISWHATLLVTVRDMMW